MSRQGRVRRIGPVAEEEAGLRPLYARVLRLRHLNPGGMLCFLFLEGAVALGLLLALAELVSWWGLLVLPMAVAVMVKANDLVAGVVARSAALVPEQERDRFRREVVPAVGRAIVPGRPVRGAARVRQPVTAEGDVSQAAAPQASYVEVPGISATGVPVVVDGANAYAPPGAGWAQPRDALSESRAVAFSRERSLAGADRHVTAQPGIAESAQQLAQGRPWRRSDQPGQAELTQWRARQSGRRRYE